MEENTPSITDTLENNGFSVSAGDNGYTVVSKATGATVLRTEKFHDLEVMAKGITYALTQNVDNAWKRPCRETGYFIVRG